MAGVGSGYFDRLCRRLLDEGCSPAEGRQAVFDAYLDGKPQASSKLKPTRSDRDRWFWASKLVGECSPDDWCTEAGILALARYLSQAKVLVDGLVEAIARAAPWALVTAMRRSRLVLMPDSPHLSALRIASALSAKVDEALRFFERPYLKFGQQLVQLPWVAALQNNGTAANNNLRRLAARRDEAAEETRLRCGNRERVGVGAHRWGQ